MKIRVIEGDALEISADVLVLKYAQGLYGVDELVVDHLRAERINFALPLPNKDSGVIDTRGCITAKGVLFIGVVSLRAFGYEEIREFSKRALTSLARTMPAASHVAFTLHGTGYGLDEAEAFRAELAGILDAVESSKHSMALELVTIVERNAGRTRRLQSPLDQILPAAGPIMAQRTIANAQYERLQSAGARSRANPDYA